MLERSLESDFTPGSNLEEQSVAFADWRFLTPNPSVASVLCLDWPSPHTEKFLRNNAAMVYVAGERQQGDTNLFQMVPFPGSSEEDGFPLADGSIHLVIAETSLAIQRLSENGRLGKELDRILAAGGALYLESNKYWNRQSEVSALQRLASGGLGQSHGWWLTPLRDAVRTAAPLDSPEANRFLFSNVLFGRSRITRALSQLIRGLSQTRLFSRSYPRRGFVVERTGQSGETPRYLQHAAERNGLSLGAHRLVVSARGRYRSNKIVYFVFPSGSPQARWVIKVSRVSEFSYRLVHEHEVLRHLDRVRPVDRKSFPAVHFLDEHQGRAILCLEASEGVPFQSVSSGKPGCPWARGAVEWLIGLSEGTKKGIEDPPQLADALHRLYQKFIRVYPLPDNEQGILRGMVERLAGSTSELCSVLQHGDPGIQNILVSPPHTSVFLDWESCELEGMPLWDLFYFLRTYVNWAERLRGRRSALNNFQAHFSKRGRFTPLIVSAVESYCARLSLDRQLIEPLFYTCWMHRCLKGVILLRPEAKWKGAYISLLRSLLQTGDGCFFSWMWSPEKPEVTPRLRKAWS